MRPFSRLITACALCSIVGIALFVLRITQAATAQDIKGSYALPPGCHTPIPSPSISYAPAPTLAPDVVQRNLQRLRRMPLQMFVEPSQPIYQFILRTSFQGMGRGQPLPAIEPNSIAFHLTDRTHDYSSQVRLLDTVPASLNPNPCRDFTGIFRTGFAIDARRLPRGMYELTASAKSQPVTLPQIGTFALSAETLMPFRFYVPRLHQTPHDRPGQAFLVFPQRDDTYYDESGLLIPRRDIVMHIAHLQGVAGTRRVFSVEGSSHKIVVTSSLPFTQLPGLLPLVDDATTKDVNRRYDGKPVWGRGGLGGNCVLENAGGTYGGGGPNSRPFTILHVFRVYHSAYELAIGGQMQASGGSRQSSFIDESPLLVWFRVPDDTVFTAAGGSAAVMGIASRLASPSPPKNITAGSHANRLGPLPQCVAWYRFFADAWDLDREYTFQTAEQAHPQWPHDILIAIAADRVVNGMTREQVAWAIGYPGVYAPISQIMRSRVWRYDNLSPFDYLVKFDVSGRVVSFGPTGELP